MNIHRRCELIVANNYGMSTRQMAEMLPGMGMGFSAHSLFQRRRVSICGFPLPENSSFSDSTSSKSLRYSADPSSSSGGDDFSRVAAVANSPMDDDCQELTLSSEELAQVSDEPDVLGASPVYRRRSNSFCVRSPTVTPASNVPRTNAVQIPFVTRRTLTHSVSCSSGVKETSSVGQELRSIGDDFDRIGGRPSRSLSLTSMLRFGRRSSDSY